jgi:hypothetical protein
VHDGGTIRSNSQSDSTASPAQRSVLISVRPSARQMIVLVVCIVALSIYLIGGPQWIDNHLSSEHVHSVIPPGLAAWASWQSDDETLVLTARPRRCYFWTSVELFHLLLRSLRRGSGGSGLTGKSGRKTANVCDASTREKNINTAANFMLVAFIKINRLSSFFSEICRHKFSKLFRSWKRGFAGGFHH